MARTSRNPAASFDALDNIDIDDMFADDGDALFDGLDLDLDQMGDITDMATPGAAQIEAVAEKPEPTPAPAPAAEELPKRRKTKRKLKSTILAGDEEDEAPTKKKRRGAKAGTTKKKTTKKEEAKSEVVVKSKNKVKGIATTQTTPKNSAVATMSQGNVAAAGRFGERQKRGHFALPLSRANSDKHKAKGKFSLKPAATKAAAKAASTSIPPTAPGSGSDKRKNKKSTTTTPAAVVPTPQPVVAPPPEKPAAFVPPTQQPSFCGLTKGSGLFYPFMPALPAEPSLKNRKQYPAIDRIHSSFTSHMNNTASATKGANGANSVGDTESIFQLLQDTLKELNPPAGQTHSAAAQENKKASISNAIVSLRQMISGMEKNKLATDLFSVCALLKRQYDFLNQNLSNMDKWCKDNFSETEYAATYGLLEAPKKQKESAVVESIFANLTKSHIKVKIKCSGFKESKVVLAVLPRSVVGSALSLTEHTKEKKSSKKRKSSVLEPSTEKSTTSAGPTLEKDDVLKIYPILRPSKRRQLVADDIALTAKELEAACITKTVARYQAIERRHTELKKLVDDDEVLVVHTAAMWQYINKAGYFSGFTREALKDTLRSVWAPEVKNNFARDMACGNQRSLTRVQDDMEGGEKSVFEGLQSLLVEVMSDDEEDTDSDDDDDDYAFSDDSFDEIIPANSALSAQMKLADLSNLTLDERAHTHLRKAGLLEEDLLGGVSSTLSLETGAADGETLEAIINRMATDLTAVSALNNARTSFLESVAGTSNFRSEEKIRRAAEETSVITKCQQVMKRKKDLKLKASKMASKDEYALPW